MSSSELFEDEASQSWILAPSPSILANAGNDASPTASGASSSAQAAASSSSSTFHRRRQHTVAAFLRQGESNEAFASRAPSILNPYGSEQQEQAQEQLRAEEEQKARARERYESKSRERSPSPSATTDHRRASVAPNPVRPIGFLRMMANLASRLRPSHRRRRRKAAAIARGEKLEEYSEGDEDEDKSSSSDDGDDEKSIMQEASQDGWSTHRRELEEEDDAEASNFATVDWGRQDEDDMLAKHTLHEPLVAPKLTPGGRGSCGVFCSKVTLLFRLVLRFLEQTWRASQGWVICGLVGLVTGLLASMVDMCVHWVIDFRIGLCADNIWLSNKACCAAVGPDNYSPDRDNNALQQVCPLWQNWDVVLTQRWGLHLGLFSDYAVTYGVYVIISGFLATLSWWLVVTWSRYAAGSGIPEIKTILGGVVIRRVLGGWTLLIKCVALVLSVSSGLSVGKEGPFVHIAACVANNICGLFARYRHNQAKKNEILSAACAAGVAVAFGAPIGGILYSFEEVSSYWSHKTMWRAFFCAIIASISVTYIDPYQDGKLAQFTISYTNQWQWLEMIPFFLIGCIGGLMGAFFIWANLKISSARKASFLAKIPYVEVCIVACLSSLIKFQSSFTRGNTTSLLEALFDDCSSPNVDPLDMCSMDFIGNTLGSLFFTTVVSLLLTTYTIGIPVPSGLLIPSLTIGASMGRLVGTAVRWAQISYPAWSAWTGCQDNRQDCITPGIYALVGGASMLGGVTRMTIALVVIMFEITGGTTYLLPIMVGVLTSKCVGDLFGTESIYEGAIEALHYPFLDVKHQVPSVLRIADAMTGVGDLLVLGIHGHTVATLHARIKTMTQLGISGFPVVTTPEEQLVVGYITRSELKAGLRHALRYGGSGGSGTVMPNTPCYFAMLDLRFPRTGAYVDLSGLLDPAPVQVSEGMALYRLHDMFSKLRCRYVIVARFGKIIGICTKKDIISTLHNYEHQKRALAKKGKLLPH